MELAATIARSLQAHMQAELRDLERAATAGTKEAGLGLKAELRRQVTSDIEDAIDGVRQIFVGTPAFALERYANLLKGRVNRDRKGGGAGATRARAAGQAPPPAEQAWLRACG